MDQYETSIQTRAQSSVMCTNVMMSSRELKWASSEPETTSANSYS